MRQRANRSEPEASLIQPVVAGAVLSSVPAILCFLVVSRLLDLTSLAMGSGPGFLLGIVAPGVGLTLNLLTLMLFAMRPDLAGWVLTARAACSLLAFACLAVLGPLVWLALQTIPFLGIPALVLCCAEVVGELLFIVAAIVYWRTWNIPNAPEATSTEVQDG